MFPPPPGTLPPRPAMPLGPQSRPPRLVKPLPQARLHATKIPPPPPPPPPTLPSPSLPSRAKAKKIKKKRNLRNRSFRLMNLPLDVFAEVASNLTPLDLLSLAKLSKRFRSVLMSRSSRFMWVTAISNVPAYGGVRFPPCPSDLPEPVYASLVFQGRCQDCGCKTSLSDLTYRERLCKRCTLSREPRGDLADFIEVCEMSNVSGDEAIEMFGLVLVSRIGRFSPHDARRVYRECMSSRAKLNSAEYRKYITERKGAMGAIKQHAIDLGRWYDGFRIEAQRLQRLEDDRVSQIVHQRYADITAILRHEGCSDEDFPRYGGDAYQKWAKIVFRGKRLTRAGWTEFGPALAKILLEEREARLETSKGLQRP